MRDRKSEPGLANAAGSGERDERDGLIEQKGADRGELGSAPDKGCARNRQRSDAVGKRREGHRAGGLRAR